MTPRKEYIQQIKTFNQVLKFDTNKHVKYFSGLWKGDPPMAPSTHIIAKRERKLRKLFVPPSSLAFQA